MVNVFSEIGPLRSVILHRPGRELLNLTPDLLEELLFDEIPYFEKAVEEHDAFARIFTANGIEVLYLEDLAAEAISNPEIRQEFVGEFIEEAHVHDPADAAYLRDMFAELDNRSLILKTMEGIRREEMPSRGNIFSNSLRDSLFVTKPMPNLYFTRDPFSLMGRSISLNKMWSDIRSRETIYGKFIFRYHPRFAGTGHIYNRDFPYSIEGGDELILNRETLAIGISQRTESRAVELLASNVLERGEFKKILAFVIPEKRAFMHLDTVFTMVDRDAFTVHPEIEGPLEVYSITKGEKSLEFERHEAPLEETLADALHLDSIRLIRCAGGNPIDAAREQWSDGSNTLAIRPGEVIVYDRNTVTNKALADAGCRLHVMSSGELSRGRGGPRCMSMPVIRDDLNA